ncbi:MAG: transketolase C-terminal domain-containing protein [Syntrophales bacterium]
MRNAFANEITSLAAIDERIVVLSGDIGNRLFDDFKNVAPARFYNCGVAEANMTGVAAGMAMMGLRPITYTITPFATTRCLEQIRNDVCYHNLPVIITGTGSGLSYAELGPTHHSCEDIAILRALPNISVICPCDPIEVRCALRAAMQHDGPIYLRLGKKGEPALHKTTPDFKIGRAINMREGNDICLLSTGSTMELSLGIADALASYGISSRVESVHTVKPLDGILLEELGRGYRLVVTIEEHSLIGGLGSAVAEWFSDRDSRDVRLLRYGTADCFLETVGSQEYARTFYGLERSRIADEVKAAFGKDAR